VDYERRRNGLLRFEVEFQVLVSGSALERQESMSRVQVRTYASNVIQD